MRLKKLGKDGPTVSAVGLGCMGMSDFYGSKATRNDTESIETLKAALDLGVTLINTGDFYGVGHNELLISQVLKQSAHKPLISVKFGALRTPQGGFSGIDARPVAVKNFIAYSLVRLGVDVIDIYQPARVDPSVPIEETVEAIADLIKEGKVRYLGLSEASPEILRRAHKVHPVTAIEIEYSLATRVIETELLATARDLGVGVVAYGVLSRGLLSGALTGSFEASDFRNYAPRFTGKNFETNQKRISLLQEIAKNKACTASQLAIAWVLHQGDDIVPLLGTTNRDRLKENLAAVEIELSQSELEELNRSFPDGIFEGERYDSKSMQLVVK